MLYVFYMTVSFHLKNCLLYCIRHLLSCLYLIIKRLGSSKPVYVIHRSDQTMGFRIN